MPQIVGNVNFRLTTDLFQHGATVLPHNITTPFAFRSKKGLCVAPQYHYSPCLSIRVFEVQSRKWMRNHGDFFGRCCVATRRMNRPSNMNGVLQWGSNREWSIWDDGNSDNFQSQLEQRSFVFNHGMFRCEQIVDIQFSSTASMATFSSANWPMSDYSCIEKLQWCCGRALKCLNLQSEVRTLPEETISVELSYQIFSLFEISASNLPHPSVTNRDVRGTLNYKLRTFVSVHVWLFSHHSAIHCWVSWNRNPIYKGGCIHCGFLN